MDYATSPWYQRKTLHLHEGLPCNKELCQFFPVVTADSTAPVSAEELNPLVKRFHTKCRAPIYAIGGRSALLWTPEGLTAKISFRVGDQRLRDEQDVFGLLEECSCPHIVQCLFSRPDITFMPFISGRNLGDRMAMINTLRPILPWVFQITTAAAALETLGFAHGDINPRNILIDDRDQLILIDLDHALPIGGDLEVGYESYVRIHRVGEMDGGGSYGKAGAATEQFALGSIFWYLTRGEELYAELDGFTKVNRLCYRQFAELALDDPIDNVISKCWWGKFDRLADLVDEIRMIATEQGMLDSISNARRLSDSEYPSKRELCEHHYSLALEVSTAQSPQDNIDTNGVHEATTSTWWKIALDAAYYLKEGLQSGRSFQRIAIAGIISAGVFATIALIRR